MKYSAWQGLKINEFTKGEQKQNPLATVIDTLKVYLRNEFDFWKVHGIMNTSDLLQSK